MKIEIITNPATKMFFELVRSSKEQLFASPFIKANIAKTILDNKPSDSQISFLTSYKLNNFYRGSSDLVALKCFLENHIRVRNYSSLHAKTYIFDAQCAIVTSANLTSGGLENNYECGLLVHDENIAAKLKVEFLKLFFDKESTSVVTQEIIATTEEILSKVPAEKRIKFEKSEKDIFIKPQRYQLDDLYDGGTETIAAILSGWRRDVFNAVCKIGTPIFKLDQVYAFKSDLQKLHPRNQNVADKIRQQLQELRNLGLIEFVGRGVYRKLWKQD